MQKLQYFLRPSTCFIHQALLENYDKTVRNGHSKVCNVRELRRHWRPHLALPAEMGGLGVSSASLLALLVGLISAFDASDFLTTIFSEISEDVSLTKTLEK